MVYWDGLLWWFFVTVVAAVSTQDAGTISLMLLLELLSTILHYKFNSDPQQ